MGTGYAGMRGEASEAAKTYAKCLSALVFEPSVRLRDFERSGVTAWPKSML